MKKNKNFSTDIDRVLLGTYPKGEMVYVCDTPELLQAVGLKNLPILMTQKHIVNALLPESQSTYRDHCHELDREYMDMLPSKLNQPAIILNSTKINSMVMVGCDLDFASRPIIIALLKDGTGMYNAEDVTTNFLTSTYGRSGFDTFLSNAINSNSLMFYDKKTSDSLLNTIGSQCTKALTNYHSNTIIHNIDKKVNGFSQKIFLENSDIFYTEESELGIKSVRSGNISRHVLGSDRMDYIIDGQFVRMEEVSDDVLALKKRVAAHNTPTLSAALHNAAYPSEYKEALLNGRLFSNDGFAYEVISYCQQIEKAVLKSVSSAPNFYLASGLGEKSDEHSLRWSSSTFYGSDLRGAMEEYFSTEIESENERG